MRILYTEYWLVFETLPELVQFFMIALFWIGAVLLILLVVMGIDTKSKTIAGIVSILFMILIIGVVVYYTEGRKTSNVVKMRTVEIESGFTGWSDMIRDYEILEQKSDTIYILKPRERMVDE